MCVFLFLMIINHCVCFASHSHLHQSTHSVSHSLARTQSLLFRPISVFRKLFIHFPTYFPFFFCFFFVHITFCTRSTFLKIAHVCICANFSFCLFRERVDCIVFLSDYARYTMCIVSFATNFSFFVYAFFVILQATILHINKLLEIPLHTDFLHSFFFVFKYVCVCE